MRTLFVLVLVAAVGCGTLHRHPRASIVGGATLVGAMGFGLPLANECTPQGPGECGVRHDAAYIGASALAGALIGVWIAYQWWLQDAGRRAAEAEVPKAAKK